MRKIYFLILFLIMSLQVISQPVNGKLIPVTTNSKSALSFYNQAIKSLDDVKVKDALENFKKALNQDNDFFMANYQLSLYSLMNRDINSFREYANAALSSNAKLSDAEDILKEALVRLKQGRVDFTDLGKKLVELYPYDPNSYNNLVSYQSLAGDSAGVVETLNKAIKIASRPATFYNQLGYAYPSWL